jgi:ABC-2 type transport system ATP-binding protein
MYKDIVDFAELKKFMDQKLKNYSSGMQVRLAFSMAVRAEADVLLIDEVLAVGDADFQRKCFDYFKTLKKNKKTVVFVSHDMDAVREYCDRALLIEESRVIRMGDTGEIAQEYLKLFMTEDHKKKTFDQDRWGDQSALTERISVSVKPSSIVISQKIKATQETEGIIPGFRIKDAAGKDILGTNARVEKIRIPSMPKGQVIEIKWQFANILWHNCG